MINPLKCIYAGKHIGWMETAAGVETQVWECRRLGRPTTTAMCYGLGCATMTSPDLPDGTEPLPENSYADGP